MHERGVLELVTNLQVNKVELDLAASEPYTSDVFHNVVTVDDKEREVKYWGLCWRKHMRSYTRLG